MTYELHGKLDLYKHSLLAISSGISHGRNQRLQPPLPALHVSHNKTVVWTYMQMHKSPPVPIVIACHCYVRLLYVIW